MHAVDPEVSESVSQLTGMWSKLIEDVGGLVSDDEGLAVRWADAEFGFYNAIVATDRVTGEEQLRHLLSQSVKVMDKQTQPGSLWIFKELVAPDTRAKIGDLAREVGLAPSLTCWGMAGELASMAEPSHPNLRFERVTSAEHLDMYASLNARAYGLSEAGARATFRGSRLWRNEIFAYVALEGSQPVACAGACEVDRRLFLIMVATDPSSQRRGFGEAATRKALFEAGQATGITRVCLQATEAGRPVYERIGLRHNSVLQLFSRHG